MASIEHISSAKKRHFEVSAMFNQEQDADFSSYGPLSSSIAITSDVAGYGRQFFHD
jgi:hypothetical protein